MNRKLFHLSRIILVFLATVSLQTQAEQQEQSSTHPVIEIPKWEPDDSALLILEIKTATHHFEDVVSAYKYKDVILIPIGALSEIIEIAITSEPGKGIAHGYVFKPQNTFYLDIDQNKVTLKGVPQAYVSNLIQVLPDDIYIESSLISDWLPIQLEVDLFASTLKISSEDMLPFERRLDREKRIAKTKALKKLVQNEYPKHKDAYKLWNTPFIDQSVQANTQNINNNSSSTLSYTTYATADLLKHEASMYLSGNNDDVFNDARLTIGRYDPYSELLGFMKATSYTMGNVAEPRLNLITTATIQNVGASVGNIPLTRQQEFDRHRFRGDLLPGWEVELYHNNALLDYQTEAIEGQYDFQDVPLFFGSNHFKLIFYGPRGEIREEEYRFELGQSLISEGNHYYHGAVTDNENGGKRITLDYDVGLTKSVSGNINYASIPLIEGIENVQHNYITTGISTFFESFFITLDLISDSNGGNATDLSLQTRVDSTILSVNETRFSDFFSEEFQPNQQALDSRSRYRINTAIAPDNLPRIPVTLEIINETFSNGDERNKYINFISTNVYSLALNNELSLTQTTNQNDTFTGSFQISHHSQNYGIRSTINYQLEPANEFTNISASIDPTKPLGEYKMSYGLNYNLLQDIFDVQATATKNIGKYSLSLGARLNTNGDYSLDARFSVGLGKEPRNDRWQIHANSMAGQGSVSANVFLDKDQDGIFGGDDEQLEGIKFTVNGRNREVTTDGNGIAFITGLSRHQPTSVGITIESLEDPLYKPVLEGIEIVPRPGHTTLLEFPVFLTGEIDGTVLVEKHGKETGVGNVKVEIIDSNGRIIRSSTTEYDGFYIISNIPLGHYTARVSSEHLDSLIIKKHYGDNINIDADQQFISGIDFLLAIKP